MERTSDFRFIPEEKGKTDFLLKILMDHSTDAIAIYDIELRLIFLNSKAEEITGLKIKEAMGKNFLEIYPEGDSSKSYLDLLRAIKGETIHNTRFDSVLTHRTYENYLFPLRDESNAIYAVLAIAHDFTEHIKTAVELEKAYRILEEQNRELEKRNKELGSFTYIASHDLQEPLRKIQAFGKRIVEKETENLSDTGKDYLNRMVDAAQRMQNLIDSLLEFSRATTSTKKLELSDLNALIEEVKKENAFSTDDKPVIIEVAPLPMLLVIPFQFKQLVANLFSNSVKYVKPGLIPHIKVGVDIVPSESLNRTDIIQNINYCRISFEDNGIGFDQMYADQIFELFQRLHGRSEYSGSGIGLSICKKIAENHEGFIVAKGKPNAGATFYLYLPMKH